MDLKMEIKEEDTIGDEYNKYSERLVLEDMSIDRNNQRDKVLDVSEYICSQSSCEDDLIESKDHITAMKGHVEPIDVDADDITMKLVKQRVASKPLRVYQRQSKTKLIDSDTKEVNLAEHGPKNRKLSSGERCESGSVTPSGHITSIAEAATPADFLHMGEVKPKSEPLSPHSSAALEQVEVIDLKTEELQADSEDSRNCLGQVCSVAGPRSSSNDPNASGNGSLMDSANTTHSVGNVTADVLPLTSTVSKTSSPTATRARNGGSEFDSDFDDELDEIAPGRGVLSSRNIPDDEELDDPARDIINAVERAMDDEADALGISSSFVWLPGFDSFRGVPETFTGPTPGPVKDYNTPYDAFIDIWDENIIAHIARETNRYVHQTIEGETAKDKLYCPRSPMLQWKNTTADEILALFGIYILMGIDTRASHEEYWKTNTCLEMSAFRKIMPLNRYVLLNKFLHFADSLDTSQSHLQYGGITLSPKLAPIAPLISHLDIRFSSLYNLKREVTVDESLTLFKGRLSWAETIRSNAASSGIKSYELCESESGYLYRFQILHTGKNSDNVGSANFAAADLAGKSYKAVLYLLKGLEHRGHCVTMDNLYNSPSLARYLKTKGFDCLGTLRVNRRHVPDAIAKMPNNVAKGTIIARHSGDVSILSWKDSKVVTMISTYHNDKTSVQPKAARLLVKPISVRVYNNLMAGVDVKDKQLSMYLLEQKKVKWYVKMFKRLLNVSVHNAFIMTKMSSERRNRPVLTHREFRYQLADELVRRHSSEKRLHLEPPATGIIRLRRDVLHCPVNFRGHKYRRRCVVCKRQVKDVNMNLKCQTCDVFLCFGDCWMKYHTLQKLRKISLTKK